jgi:pimeloyl-ACP methyl ester carboxylesterase
MSRPPPVHNTRPHRKLFLWIGLGLVSLLVIAYLGIGAVAAGQLTVPKRVFDPALNPGTFNLTYEDFRLPARGDRLNIAAWYIPSEKNERAIVLVHGRNNSRSNGFEDHFVSFANVLHKAGFSVLMIDLRGHGESDDSRFTFGIKERQDVLGAVDWLETRGVQPGKIGVLGYSLGGASVIGAAAEESDIGAIWVDSSYADIKSVIEANWVKESGLPLIFLRSTQWMGQLLYGFDITTSRPVDEIGKIAPRPIFIAHCTQDKMIPIAHMDRLLAAAKNTQTWVIPGCEHALGYSLVPEEYNQKAVQFFDESLQ